MIGRGYDFLLLVLIQVIYLCYVMWKDRTIELLIKSIAVMTINGFGLLPGEPLGVWKNKGEGKEGEGEGQDNIYKCLVGLL